MEILGYFRQICKAVSFEFGVKGVERCFNRQKLKSFQLNWLPEYYEIPEKRTPIEVHFPLMKLLRNIWTTKSRSVAPSIIPKVVKDRFKSKQ